MKSLLSNTPFGRLAGCVISLVLLVTCVSLVVANEQLNQTTRDGKALADERAFSGPYRVLAESPIGERLVMYFDSGLSSQSYCPGQIAESYTAHVVLENVDIGTYGTVRAVTFAISAPPSAIVTGSTLVIPGSIELGNLNQGIAITWPDGLDASNQLHVLDVNFVNLGCVSCTVNGEPVSIINPPAPGGLTPFVSCQLGDTGDVLFTDLAVTGETSYTCQGTPPVSVEESTWGLIKSLYR